MANFNLSVGMNKEQVLQMANKLGEATRIKVINFFDNDKDGKISHVNELAILNSIFDGTGKVKMPTIENGYNERTSTVIQKYADGTEEFSMLCDYDLDGYADEHHMLQHWQKDGRILGYQGNDKNLDGVMDKKHFYNIQDSEHVPQYADTETVEMVEWDDERVNSKKETNTQENKFQPIKGIKNKLSEYLNINSIKKFN